MPGDWCRDSTSSPLWVDTHRLVALGCRTRQVQMIHLLLWRDPTYEHSTIAGDGDRRP